MLKKSTDMDLDTLSQNFFQLQTRTNRLIFLILKK